MDLKKYREKRNFTITREPTGHRKKKKIIKEPIFVIQKHAARHLHYDLRLEMDGVLKSWAVPKGPSLDPASKRLAVAVEDHPLEYGSFEGTIPTGQYGAGSVLLWDTGTWNCETDPNQAYHKGDITFTLQGQKLKGTWKLIRMKSNDEPEGKNWLLMKVKDKHSKKNYDVLIKQPFSVKRNPILNESENKIKTLKPSKLTHVKRAVFPSEFKPSLAFLTQKVPEGDDWLHEIKFDGYRILCMINHGKIQILTRNGHDWSKPLSFLADELKAMGNKNLILDGELVAIDKKGISNFQILQNSLKKSNPTTLKLFVFDIPYYEGYSLNNMPLIERKKILYKLLKNIKRKKSHILYTEHIIGHGEDVFKQACDASLEGIISKKISSHYEQHRSKNWLKSKCTNQQEFIIAGFTKPEKSRKYFGSILLGYYNEKQQLQYCGHVGTGFSEKSLQDLYQKFKKIIQKKSSFYNVPDVGSIKNITWLKPKYICQIKFLTWTDNRILRQPSFLGLREDKNLEEVKIEMPILGSPTQGADDHTKQKRVKQKSSDSLSTLSNKKMQALSLPIKNVDKIFYPQVGLTKLAVASYYDAISEWILPHLIKRPLSLLRCPSGVTETCFFQKHMQGSNYIFVKNKKDLLDLIQLGTLEIHPWGSKMNSLENPDRIIFDLDPGPYVAWSQVIDAALAIRKQLKKLGLISFVKTSGGKGLHIVVPILKKWNWNQIKSYSKVFALEMVKQNPHIFIGTMNKSKRDHKIFIDYLRNDRGATAVAAYSTRAREKATISVPLTWRELKTLKSPETYTLLNIMTRIKKLKKDPWEGFFECKQSIDIQSGFSIKK